MAEWNLKRPSYHWSIAIMEVEGEQWSNELMILDSNMKIIKKKVFPREFFKISDFEVIFRKSYYFMSFSNNKQIFVTFLYNIINFHVSI